LDLSETEDKVFGSLDDIAIRFFLEHEYSSSGARPRGALI
jgi:hypothetical protein